MNKPAAEAVRYPKLRSRSASEPGGSPVGQPRGWRRSWLCFSSGDWSSPSSSTGGSARTESLRRVGRSVEAFPSLLDAAAVFSQLARDGLGHLHRDFPVSEPAVQTPGWFVASEHA